MKDVRRARDGNDMLPKGGHPSDAKLSRRAPFCGGKGFERVDHGGIILHHLFVQIHAYLASIDGGQ